MAFSSELSVSKKRKHQFDQFQYACDQCDYVASYRSKLIKHNNVKHKGIRYPCDQCDFAATQPSTLKKHKKSMHEGVRYPCDQCNYVATWQSALIRHKNAKHKGVRYPCDQCDYVATHASALKRHKKAKKQDPLRTEGMWFNKYVHCSFSLFLSFFFLSRLYLFLYLSI